jgi:hypothetical protein
MSESCQLFFLIFKSKMERFLLFDDNDESDVSLFNFESDDDNLNWKELEEVQNSDEEEEEFILQDTEGLFLLSIL